MLFRGQAEKKEIAGTGEHLQETGESLAQAALTVCSRLATLLMGHLQSAAGTPPHRRCQKNECRSYGPCAALSNVGRLRRMSWSGWIRGYQRLGMSDGLASPSFVGNGWLP